MSTAAIGDRYDVVTVGAGPAGLAAAAITAKAGLKTLLLDENPGPGGQIYRAITTTPLQDRRLLGTDYWHGSSLVTAARESGAEIVQGATVWSLDRALKLGVSSGGTARMITPKRVILATGALERPFPIPGWTLPGVMTAGGAQTLLKSSGMVPAGRTVLAGCGPLLWLLASQLIASGGRVDAILDTTDPEARRRAARMAGNFILSPYLAKGLALVAKVRRKVRVISGVMRLAAEGDGQVSSVTFTTRAGRNDRIPVDTLLLHQGVVPNTNLAMAAGVEHHWDEVQLCWKPVIDAFGTTPIDGIAIAGDGAGIGGARVAEERGRLAAIAAARALGVAAHPAVPGEEDVKARLARVERGRAFLDTLYAPAREFRVPEGPVIACRCEEVTAAMVRETVALGCEGPNQMKSFLRSGMGPCQGRLCGLTITEIIADERGVSPAAVGHYRLRPPVKPVTVAEIASLSRTEAETKAVVRT